MENTFISLQFICLLCLPMHLKFWIHKLMVQPFEIHLSGTFGKRLRKFSFGRSSVSLENNFTYPGITMKVIFSSFDPIWQHFNSVTYHNLIASHTGRWSPVKDSLNSTCTKQTLSISSVCHIQVGINCALLQIHEFVPWKVILLLEALQCPSCIIQH